MTALYIIASAVGLIAAALCYQANAPYRGMIENSLAPMKLPERVYPFYGASYLNDFIRSANIQTASGKTVLEFYIRPVLLWIDVGFAIFFAGFAAFFWFGLLELSLGYVWLDKASRFFLTMSVVYGLADVAEDLWLVRLFSKKGPVNWIEGLTAGALTQTKLVTIILSGVGGPVFQGLGVIFAKPK
jgi:hypothetical protein